MPRFQAYIVGSDGHIHQRIDIEGGDVEAVRERAKRLVVEGRAVELWEGDHLIETFEPEHE